MERRKLRVGLCQINTVPGDIPGNLARIIAAATQAQAQEADLAIFPELAIEGYSPRDLLMRQRFQEAAAEARQELASRLNGLPVLLGTTLPNPGPGRPLLNVAMLLDGGEEQEHFAKTLLPHYDVFDETRYFEPGQPGATLEFRGLRIGVTICEDIWAQADPDTPSRYGTDPVEVLAEQDLDLLVNLSASPFGHGRPAFRETLLGGVARRVRCPALLCNLVGGNDEILFDGHSLAVSAAGDVIARAPGFESSVIVADLGETSEVPLERPDRAIELHRALVMGIADYTRKCGFDSVHLGLSGGVDSAVTAALAVDALGASKMSALALPSRFSSQASLEDAHQLANLLDIRLDVLPIAQPYDVLCRQVYKIVGEGSFGVMEENIQARIRGLLLMAIANRTGSLLLSTGNKSELSVGYCTLYGDMSGGLAVLSDVWKEDVYALARLYEQQGRMPARIITKEPSAELRPGQRDRDSLPPYERLDRVLQLHVEEELDARDILERHPDYALEEIQTVLALVARNEYKRKQAPPGLRVSGKAFGFGRRMPIVAGNLDFLNQPGDTDA